MKKIKIFSAILMVMITIFANSMVAFAAPQTMPDGNTFDPEYYAEHNPDVVAVFGTDANALYNHYKTYGIKEGRLPYDGAAVSSVKNSNVSASLAQARYDVFYNKKDVYVYDPSVLFDADYYLANYPELATTIGTDYKALFNHYINYGRFEGRTARIGIYPERGKWIPGISFTDSFVKDFTKCNFDLQLIEYLSTIVNDTMSEREIVTIIHDDICNKTEYSLACKQTAYNFEDFINGNYRLACNGYSSTFRKMCLFVGIECQTVGSLEMLHEWNQVKIDGVWYDVDVTWDDSQSNKNYFLIPTGTGVFANRHIDSVNGLYYNLDKVWNK